MSEIKLHNGVWTRQVLQRKRKVRVTFIPDNLARPLQTTQIDIDDDSKTAWEKLLGGNPEYDINLGILIVRFNSDGESGTAVFLSNLRSQPEVVHAFQQTDPVTNIPTVGLRQFLDCINDRRSALGPNFNYPSAFSECLSQLLI